MTTPTDIAAGAESSAHPETRSIDAGTIPVSETGWGMGRSDAAERWAAAMVRAATDAAVRIHDDGSEPSMYDLALVYPNGRTAAIEVTAAADSVAIEQWNLMNGRQERWTDARIRGGWLVSTHRGARWNRLRAELPLLLGDAERTGVRRIDPEDWRRPTEIEQRAIALGVDHAGQSGTEFPGSIYLTISPEPGKDGGAVPHSAEPVASWVGHFLREPACNDVVSKLAGADTDERHAFVFLPGFTTAPFDVAEVMTWGQRELPLSAPSLPHPLTDIWVCSGWSAGAGLRWSRDGGWSWFDKLLDRNIAVVD